MMAVKSDWDRAVEFHGHVCVGLALGYRVARVALRELDSHLSPDEQLVAIVETDNCAVDAIQVLTGCTFGKGNLLFRDYGKAAFTFGRRDTGEAVRIYVKGPGEALGPEFAELRLKIAAHKAGKEDLMAWQTKQQNAPYIILEAPEYDLMEIKEVKLDLPAKASIFSSVTCAVCGEQVMEPRARLSMGKTVCIPDSDDYTRHY
jgi:formylmethanofuran dehydrogenase subunit E